MTSRRSRGFLLFQFGEVLAGGKGGGFFFGTFAVGKGYRCKKQKG